MMKPKLESYFDAELVAARTARDGGDLDASWSALERAHVLSQAHAWPHVRVHWAMFRLAWRRRDMREVLGQLPRLLLAGPGSLLGRAPKGNTGGANVGIFTPMPIPDELARKLTE